MLQCTKIVGVYRTEFGVRLFCVARGVSRGSRRILTDPLAAEL